MSDAGTIFGIGLALGLLVLLGVPAWKAMGSTAGWVKGLTLAGMAVVLLAIVAGSMISTNAPREAATETAEAPSMAAPPPAAPGPTAEAPASSPKKAKPPEPVGSGAPSPSTVPDLEPGAGAPPPSGDERARAEEQDRRAAEHAYELSRREAEEAMAQQRRETDGAQSGGATRGLGDIGSPSGGGPGSGGSSGTAEAVPPPAPAPAPAPAPSAPAMGEAKPDDAAKTEWDIVPVYYGTDRARADLADRPDYGNERGRRLELGQALVTVPRSHTVPQIERPWSVRIPYFDIVIGESEDPNDHFTMKEVKPLSRDEFLEVVRARLAASSRYKKHALIFVHGYNTTFDFAIFRTAQIAYDLKFDGAPFSYSWPSGGGLASYTFDRERSGQSGKFLKEYIELVLDQTGAEAVSVVAHSMGNQPMLQVLKDLKAARPNGVVFNQIILAAPDVDRDSFADIASEIQGLAKNITLYAAENDTALAISRGVNGGSRAGDIPAGGPLVLPGVDTLDVTGVSTDSLGINHSGYAENNKLLKDIELLVSTGAAPSVRMPSLEVVPLGTGKYWRFPRATSAGPP
ncbi:MAG: alpha/beta hydrolase [Hyphomicrobium sp.]